MNTKVKGEAIKENSIPLNALSKTIVKSDISIKDYILEMLNTYDIIEDTSDVFYIPLDERAKDLVGHYCLKDKYGYERYTPYLNRSSIKDFNKKAFEFTIRENNEVIDEQYPYFADVWFPNEDVNIYNIDKIAFFNQVFAEGELYKKHSGINGEAQVDDHVIKDVPQYISDKDQALTNLGIDPVVWKYICNPLIIYDQAIVPPELLENGKFKYKNAAMYKVVLNPDTTNFNDYKNDYNIPENVPINVSRVTDYGIILNDSTIEGTSYYIDISIEDYDGDIKFIVRVEPE